MIWLKAESLSLSAYDIRFFFFRLSFPLEMKLLIAS
jgi:hypothetical protein